MGTAWRLARGLLLWSLYEKPNTGWTGPLGARLRSCRRCPGAGQECALFGQTIALRTKTEPEVSMAPSLFSILLGLVACLIPPYALRLNRLFGMRRVGWVLFTVFSLLAVLEWVRFWLPLRFGLEPGLILDLLNFLIPVLLLTVMAHIDLFLRQRLRLEMQEQAAKAGLEAQVKQRTAELDAANDELQREISLRRQGEEELRKSKEQYRFLFEQNPLPMWIYELSTFRFLAFNAAAVRHYGFSASEFGELNAKALCAASDAEAFVADSASSGPGVQRRGLWRHRKKDGTQVDMELTSLDLTYAGCPSRLVLANDATARRRLHRQLLETQRRELTTQLAGGVADRFERLISGMEAEAQVLVQIDTEPSTTEALKRIAANAASASNLTRQLLALVGRHPMQPRPIDLTSLVEQELPRIKAIVGENIQVETQLRASSPPVLADPGVVQQVLEALVRNAAEAMPTGGKLLLGTAAVRFDETSAGLEDDMRPGTFVCLTVADTGSGMSLETQARLFEPFFTTKTASKANGLGLATVHGLVKQHGGWVKLTSQPGAGTQVIVCFPCGFVTGTVERTPALVSAAPV
jgi:PAS domain S-box-containing protein